jgi:hypothetical protein
MIVEVLVLAVAGAYTLAAYRVAARYHSSAARQKRALRRAKIWRIGELPEDTIGRVIGTARPVGRALSAPITGRECVCYVVTVKEKDARPVLVREQEGVPFVLEDGSGRALVDPEGAELERDHANLSQSGMLEDPTAQQRAFLTSHGQASQGWLFNRAFTYREEIVRVGETICVAGAGIREVDPDAEVGEGYRAAPPTRLRFTSSPKFRILITDAPPER